VWDETRVLDGTIGDFIVVARRRGADWYLGAMTDWTPRSGKVDLSFLGGGEFQMTSYEDGPDAERKASDYRKIVAPVTKASQITMKLAPGGGWVARIQPRKK
jgi:alpha-glucosidase